MKYYDPEDFEGEYSSIPEGESFDKLVTEVLQEYAGKQIEDMAQEVVELRTMVYQEGMVWENMFILRPPRGDDDGRNYMSSSSGMFLGSASVVTLE